MHDPRDFHIPESTANKLSREEAEEMKLLVFRRWPPFLSGSEIKIVLFIYDRTVHYMKRWEYVSIETLSHGFPLSEYRDAVKRFRVDRKFYKNLTAKERSILGNGEHWLTPPTGLSRRQIVTALDSLERRGFIFRIARGGVPEVALNPDVNTDHIELMVNMK